MRTPESLHSAMDCFRRAIQMFPAYSLAFSALGECYFFMALWGEPPTTVMPHARANVMQALEIDDDNAEAHALFGAIRSAYDWDWAAATAEFERALAIDDKAPGAYCWYSAHLVSLGRYDEAVHGVRLAQAAELPMTSVVVNAHAAKILIVAGRYDEARSLLASLRTQNPNFYLSPCYLGMPDGMVGQEYGPAIESLQEAAELSGQNSSVLALLGSVNARAGRTSDAENVLSELLDRRSRMYIAATDMASLYFDLGRHDEAFNSLERAVEEKCVFLSWLASWPPLRDLSLDPRGKRILQRLGLSS
jgi:adenylate cyclase